MKRKSPWAGKPLPEILAELSMNRATGALTVGTALVDREFLFVLGELRAAKSSVESEKLGSWLVLENLITPAQKDEVLQGQEGSDVPSFGHIVVGRGILSLRTLEKSLEKLAIKILEGATRESSGEFLFTEGLEQGRLDTLPGKTTAQLILFSARAFEERGRKERALGPDDGIVSLAGALEEIVREFDLERRETTILGKLYRDRALGELRQNSRMTDEEFVEACYPLKVAGLISIRSDRSENGVEKVVDPASPQSPVVPRWGGGSGQPDPEAIRALCTRMPEINHYEFFGISIYSSYQEISEAWNTYRLLYDPARTLDPKLGDLRREVAEIYARAEEAFEVLSSPLNRPRYDRLLREEEEGAESRKTVPLPDQEAVPGSPDLPGVSELLEDIQRFLQEKKFDGAIQLAERLPAFNPNPAQLVEVAGMMMGIPRLAGRGLDYLKTALEMDPEFGPAWLKLAEHWRIRKSRERERKALERALLANSRNGEALESYRRLVGKEALERFLKRLEARERKPPGDEAADVVDR